MDAKAMDLVKRMRSMERDGHVKMLSNFSEYIESLIEENNNLRDQIKNWNKDDKIQELKEENNRTRLNSVHTMSDKEHISLQEFRKKHYDSCKGSTSTTITPTGIGNGVVVKCLKCQKEENITDIGNW